MNTDKTGASKAIITFVSGVAVGIALIKTAKSKLARKAAVNALAKGLQFKDDAQVAFETIKEDAQDVVAEAKVKQVGAKVSVEGAAKDTGAKA